MSTQDNIEGIAALVTAVAVGIGGFFSSRSAQRAEAEKAPEQPVVAALPNLEAKLDSDGLTKYLEIILRENGDLRDRLTRLEEKFDQAQNAEATFRGALGRWLSMIYDGWGKQAAMPMPGSAEDLVTLRDVLPH